MAEHGFTGSTPERFRNAGRIGGFMREFVPTSDVSPASGINFVGATVVHLFENPDQVPVRLMSDIFVKDFEDNVGESVGSGQQIISVDRVEAQGFYDEAVGLRVLQGWAGRVVVLYRHRFQGGPIARKWLSWAPLANIEANQLGHGDGPHALEKRMVQVALGSMTISPRLLVLEPPAGFPAELTRSNSLTTGANGCGVMPVTMTAAAVAITNPGVAGWISQIPDGPPSRRAHAEAAVVPARMDAAAPHAFEPAPIEGQQRHGSRKPRPYRPRRS